MRSLRTARTRSRILARAYSLALRISAERQRLDEDAQVLGGTYNSSRRASVAVVSLAGSAHADSAGAGDSLRAGDWEAAIAGVSIAGVSASKLSYSGSCFGSGCVDSTSLRRR